MIESFRNKTKHFFKPINGQSSNDIEEIVYQYISDAIVEENLDIEIKHVVLAGSRCRGLENKGSDIDIVVEYQGNMREDDLFNVLNNEKFTIEGIEVDINPIKEEDTGTIEEYLKRAEHYLKEKEQLIMMQLSKKVFVSCNKNEEVEKER